MMLRNAVKSSWFTPQRIDMPKELPGAARQIEALWGDREEVVPSPYSLTTVSNSTRTYWQRQRTFDELPKSLKRYLPYVLFFPDADSTLWLGSERGVLSAVAGMVKSARTRFVRGVIREVIRAYPIELPEFQILRLSLQQRLAADKSLALADWRRRDDAFGQLGAEAVSRLDQALRHGPTPPTEIAKLMGFNEEYMTQSQLLRRACELSLNRFAEQTAKGSPVDLQPFLDMLTPAGKLRWAHQAGYVADPLLTGCANISGESHTAQTVKEFLLRWMGDPRLPKGWAAWNAVRLDAKAVMLRWLVKSDLAEFFRIVSQGALDRHWKYRLAFWKAYLDEGYLDEAWVILGPAARATARRAQTENGSFGMLSGSTDRTQSALLLKVRGLTILEFSHNGKYRLWESGSTAAPRLYESVAPYGRTRLASGGDDTGSHMSSESYSWQRRLSDEIERRTGINMPQWKYKVRL